VKYDVEKIVTVDARRVLQQHRFHQKNAVFRGLRKHHQGSVVEPIPACNPLPLPRSIYRIARIPGPFRFVRPMHARGILQSSNQVGEISRRKLRNGRLNLGISATFIGILPILTRLFVKVHIVPEKLLHAKRRHARGDGSENRRIWVFGGRRANG
jgi:hypothetical protein